MNEQKLAATAHPVNELIQKRWSPYAFADRPVPAADLQSIFEAARWAPSSYNEQPWVYLVATKTRPDAFEKILSCLVEANQAWAQAAPVLALGCARLQFSRNDNPNGAALHDLGLASANLTFEATALGLAVHQMAGILPAKARALFHIPENVQPLTALAIGYAADPDALPETYRQRDLAARTRKPLAEFVFGGDWGQASSFT
ncbi:MAG: nitroreductase family protein [Pirellulaceae bacterium]|nr:nitroreductase family protein [Pirellulaceae bacterium]